MALAVDLTPFHVDRKIRIWLSNGAVIQGTLRSLQASIRESQEGKKTRRALHIEVTFKELTHSEGMFTLYPNNTHTRFALSSTDRFEEGI